MLRALVLALALSSLAAAPVRAQSFGEEVFRRLMLDPANFPLLPALGSTIGFGLRPALAEGLKGVAMSGAIGAPIAIGINLLAQNAIDGRIDLARAVVSGLGSTLLPIALVGLTGPAAPLIYIATSMAGSFAATWALDAWRARQKNAPADFAAGGPAAPSAGGMSLLGVVGR
jgi:hypothetical protein